MKAIDDLLEFAKAEENAARLSDDERAVLRHIAEKAKFLRHSEIVIFEEVIQ